MKKNLRVASVFIFLGMGFFSGVARGEEEVINYPSAGAGAFCGVHVGIAVGASSNGGAMGLSSSHIVFETPEAGVDPTFYQSGTEIPVPSYFTAQPGFITTAFQIGSSEMIKGGGNIQCLVDIRGGYYGQWGKSGVCGIELRYIFMPQRVHFAATLAGTALETEVEVEPVEPGVNFGSSTTASNNGFYNGISLSSPGSPQDPVDFALFQYKVTGDVDLSIDRGSTLECVVSFGHAFTSNSAIFLKLGAAVGFWQINGDFEILADCDSYWPISYPPILNSSSAVVGEFISKSYASGDEDNGLTSDFSFSQNGTFVGLVIAPTMNFKITENIMSFTEVKFSLYPGRTFSLDLSESGMGEDASMSLKMRGLNSVGVFLGVACIFGNHIE